MTDFWVMLFEAIVGYRRKGEPAMAIFYKKRLIYRSHWYGKTPPFVREETILDSSQRLFFLFLLFAVLFV